MTSVYSSSFISTQHHSTYVGQESRDQSTANVDEPHPEIHPDTGIALEEMDVMEKAFFPTECYKLSIQIMVLLFVV